ncbi:MAG TPA: glycosyltransferase family 2 protein [Selenomonadales bacterium]|nr:glycosyltransferase family 2 protein [Selenomonadales bacterium]
MDVTIVIPTYNEKDNIPALVAKIRQAMRDHPWTYEILFVDDSRDDTPALLERLSREQPQVRYIHREHERGLASAVVRGFQASSGRSIIVMDADLQHPPELIPLIVQRLSQADIVIPSRFIEGGSDGGLNAFRKFVSWAARMIGQIALKKLRNISDCTSGYFGLNRSVIDGADLDPVGWKILIEVLAKGRFGAIHEIPYAFVLRNAGESKMSAAEQWNYIRHIAKLVLNSPEDYRFYCFCLFGLLGVGVNLLALNLLVDAVHMAKPLASVSASLIALLHNFIWNDNVTWKSHDSSAWWQRMLKLPQYALICGIGVAITALSAQAFVLLDWNLYAGQFTGILLATHWSFTANNWWTWSAQTQAQAQITQEHAEILPSLGARDGKLQVLEIEESSNDQIR